MKHQFFKFSLKHLPDGKDDWVEYFHIYYYGMMKDYGRYCITFCLLSSLEDCERKLLGYEFSRLKHLIKFRAVVCAISMFNFTFQKIVKKKLNVVKDFKFT